MHQDDLLDDHFFESEYEYDVATLRPGNYVILFLTSFGLYGIWWMYKQWRFFKEKENLDIYPVARALFSIFFLHSLFEKIQDFAHAQGYQKSYSSIGLFVLFIGLNFLSRLPDPAWIFSLFGFISFIAPIRALNYALRGDELNGVDLTEFNWRQWIIVVLGSFFFLSIFAIVLMEL